MGRKEAAANRSRLSMASKDKIRFGFKKYNVSSRRIDRIWAHYRKKPDQGASPTKCGVGLNDHHTLVQGHRHAEAARPVSAPNVAADDPCEGAGCDLEP